MNWSNITKKNLKDIINEQLQSKSQYIQKNQNSDKNMISNKMEDFFNNKDKMNEFDDMYYYINEFLDLKYKNNYNSKSNLLKYSYPKISERNKSNILQNNIDNHIKNKEKTFKFMSLFELYNPYFFTNTLQNYQNNRRIDLHGLFVKEVWVFLSYLIDYNYITQKQNFEIITGKGNHSIDIPKKQFSDIKYKNNKIINQIEGTYYNKITKATKQILDYYKIKHKYEDGKILF